MQNAYGGPVAGGAIASTVMPPTVSGYKKFDLYEATTKPGGDVGQGQAAAQPAGSPTASPPGSPTAATGRPRSQAAQALQQSLSAVGIKTTLHGYPTSTYYSDFAGVPEVHEHAQHRARLRTAGVLTGQTGTASSTELVNGNAIVPAGNTNIGMLNDPVVNNGFAKAAGINDAAQRNAIWGQIDKQVMKDAVILPVVYAKALIYRPSSLTNVYFNQAYQLNNYAVLGVK